MPVIHHTHTYVKYRTRPGFYRCNDKECTHYIDAERILNKLSRCTKCGAEFQLTYEDLRKTNPTCLDCANTKKARVHRKTKALAEKAIEVYAATHAPIPEIKGPENLPYNDDEDRF